MGSDGKAILADLKGATNSTSVKTAKIDGNRLAGSVKKDGLTTINQSVSLTRRAVSDGIKLLSKSSPKLQAKVAADATALTRLASGPVAAVKSDVAATTFISDLNAAESANSGNAALAGAISKEKTDLAANRAAAQNVATQLATDLNKLATDLGSGASVGTGGTGGTTSSGLPNLVGSYAGSSTQTAGNHPGRTSGLAMTISTESTTGAFGGSITSGSTTLTLTGSVTASGAFTATFSNSSGQSITFNGHLATDGKTISGTYTSTKNSGTFTMTRS